MKLAAAKNPVLKTIKLVSEPKERWNELTLHFGTSGCWVEAVIRSGRIPPRSVRDLKDIQAHHLSKVTHFRYDDDVQSRSDQ